MDNQPLISVLMPVYNALPYVDQAIKSILEQTLGDFEFIIVDDGSTDGSTQILQKYAAQDNRICLISRANTGMSIALNQALSLARGKWIARMDADDIAMPERFARQVEFLESHPDHVAVGSRVLLIDPQDAPLVEFGKSFTHEEIDRAHLHCSGGGSVITHPAAMISREAMVKIGGYRKEFEPAEDLDLFLRLAELGRVANLKEVLLKYRQHPASIGYMRRKQQVAAAKRASQDALKRRGLDGEQGVDSFNNDQSPEELSATSNYRRWAWWALGAGHVGTARKYALASMRRAPFAAESWRVMYCSLRGR